MFPFHPRLDERLDKALICHNACPALSGDGGDEPFIFERRFRPGNKTSRLIPARARRRPLGGEAIH